MNTWIFLRGLSRETRHWGDFPAAFRAEIPDAHIVALDLPGNGLLWPMRSSTSVSATVEDCRAELVARRVRPPYRLLAMSLGAMVSIAWADRHPDELEGCVLINTSLRQFSPPYRRLRPGSYLPLLRIALPGVGADTRERTILRVTSALARDRAQIVEAWSRLRRECPVSRANVLRQLWAASRYRAPQSKPPVRLLVLAGAADALVDPDCSRRIAREWRADYAEHPAAGHDIALDDGAWVARQVREWLSRA